LNENLFVQVVILFWIASSLALLAMTGKLELLPTAVASEYRISYVDEEN
jgi:hypothetical protein